MHCSIDLSNKFQLLTLDMSSNIPLSPTLPITELDKGPLATPSPLPLLLDLSISTSTSQFLVLTRRQADSDIRFTRSESQDADARVGLA